MPSPPPIVELVPCGYIYAREHRTFSPGRSASMRTGRTSPGGYLHSVLLEHTKQIASCGYDYARKFQTFSPGRPASMRTNKLSRAGTCTRLYWTPCPGQRHQDTALEHAGHTVSGVLSLGIPDISLGGAQATLTARVTYRYTAPGGAKTRYCTRALQTYSLGRR